MFYCNYFGLIKNIELLLDKHKKINIKMIVIFVSTHPFVSSRSSLGHGLPPLTGGLQLLLLLDLTPLHSQSDHFVYNN